MSERSSGDWGQQSESFHWSTRYDDTPIFQGFLLADDNDKKNTDPESPTLNPHRAKTPAPTSRAGRNVKPTAKAKEAAIENTSAHRLGPKVKGAKRALSSRAGQKARDASDASENANNVENTHECRKVKDAEPSHAGQKARDVKSTSRAGQKVEDADDNTRTCAGLRAKDAEDTTATGNSRAGRKVNDAEAAKRPIKLETS